MKMTMEEWLETFKSQDYEEFQGCDFESEETVEVE